MAIRLNAAQRIAIREALPFRSEYPSIAIGAARHGETSLQAHRELVQIRHARRVLADPRSSVMQRSGAAWGLAANQRMLANLRAARRLVREA